MDGLGEVGAGDFWGMVEVGNGLGDLEEAVKDTGGEVELLSGGLHEGLGFVIHLDEVFEIAGGHACIGAGRSETLSLGGSGGNDPFANSCARGTGGDGGEFFRFEAGDVDVEVDAVEKGA